jgi:ABC-type enterochelin transport system substrate-binding protein
LDAAMAVDVMPVASAMSYQGFPAYLPDAEVVNLGEDEDIDLELIGQQNPGLILVNVQEGAAVEDTPYEEMSRIAPTVPIVTGQHDFEKVAQQVGRAGLTFEPMLAGAQMNSEIGAFYETSLELLSEAAGEHAFVYSTDEGVVEKTQADAGVAAAVVVPQRHRARGRLRALDAWAGLSGGPRSARRYRACLRSRRQLSSSACCPTQWPTG